MNKPPGIHLLFPGASNAREFGSIEAPHLVHLLRPVTALLWIAVFAFEVYRIVGEGASANYLLLALSTALFAAVQGQTWYEESEQGQRFRQALERIRGQIYEDDSTALPNSRHFVFQLRRQMMRSVRNGSGFSLMLLTIAPREGAAAPKEETLRATAKAMRQGIGEGDFVARLQGPTFGALLLDDPDDSATAKSQRITQLVARNLDEPPASSITGYEGELEVRDFLRRAQRDLIGARPALTPIAAEIETTKKLEARGAA